MYLTDFHVHSNISFDSPASMEDMLRAEAASGVRTVCFTNHCDPVRWQDDRFNPYCRTVTREEVRQIAALRPLFPELEILVGLELAEGCRMPELTYELASDEDLDFILGSLHTLSGIGDFYLQTYSTVAQCDCYFDLYLDELQRIADMDFYDVLAHVGYVRRYMWRSGVDASLSIEKFGERIEHLFRTVIAKGKGLELNCSGLRDGCGAFPDAELLRLYRRLGGEIVTVGSDAHTPATAAACLREGYDLLRECGFSYVSLFRKHKPEFIKL